MKSKLLSLALSLIFFGGQVVLSSVFSPSPKNFDFRFKDSFFPFWEKRCLTVCGCELLAKLFHSMNMDVPSGTGGLGKFVRSKSMRIHSETVTVHSWKMSNAFLFFFTGKLLRRPTVNDYRWDYQCTIIIVFGPKATINHSMHHKLLHETSEY